MKHTLEGHKWFPVIAWITFLGFAGFVFFLAFSLQSDLEHLNRKMETAEAAINSQPPK